MTEENTRHASAGREGRGGENDGSRSAETASDRSLRRYYAKLEDRLDDREENTRHARDDTGLMGRSPPILIR
jgi:hypothetical protein